LPRPPLLASPRTTNAWAHLPSASPLRFPRRGRSDRLESQPLSTLDLGWARTRWYWNINQLCIDYASRPRLSSRLTLGGLAFPRNPWLTAEGFSPLSRYSCQHSHSITLHDGSLRRFSARSTLPYPLPLTRKSAASALGLSPVKLSAQDHSTSELLRTLSRVAASKPTSWLSLRSHIVSHLA